MILMYYYCGEPYHCICSGYDLFEISSDHPKYNDTSLLLVIYGNKEHKEHPIYSSIDLYQYTINGWEKVIKKPSGVCCGSFLPWY